MNLLQNYASKLLCKIDKPSILEKFYPVPEKYITLNAGGGMPAKTYDFWNIVLDFINPVLKEKNIQIVQLGDKNEPRLNGTIYLAGQTDVHQSAYVVKNATLHAGTDSFLVHLAGSFNTPILGLYSVSPPSICGSYFGDKEKQINLEPNFAPNQSYSYNPGEQVKVINTIKPEKIIESIGKILEIDFPKIETIYIGNKFNALTTEVIPDCIIPLEYFPGQPIAIRLDLVEKVDDQVLNFAYQNLFNRQCSFRINSEINIDPILQNPRMKQNLSGILVDLSTNEFSEDFVKSLLDNQIRFILAYSGADNEKLNQLKLKFCEYGIIQKFEKENAELKKIIEDYNFSPDKIFGKSNRVLVSENKIHLGTTPWRDKVSVDQTQNLQFPLAFLKNWREIAEDADFLFLYKKIS